MEGVSAWPNDDPPSWLDYDLESVYKSVCEEYSSQCTVVTYIGRNSTGSTQRKKGGS